MIRYLDADGWSLPISSLVFSGGELHTTTPQDEGDISGTVVVAAHIQSAHDLVELCLATDLLRRKAAPGTRFNLSIPYFPYARQDRVTDPNAAFSLKTIAKMINALGYDEVRIFDPHSDVTPALLDNCIIIEQHEIMGTWPGLSEWMATEKPTIVAPDAGARKKAAKLASLHGLPLITADKVRDPLTGKITDTHVPESDAKTFLIADDICDGGRTFTEIGKRLKERGPCTVALYVTHGIFSAGYEVFQGSIDRIYTTNTFLPNKPALSSEIAMFIFEIPFI